MRCSFQAAFEPVCRKYTKNGAKYCPEHNGLPCVSCGRQATGTCTEIVESAMRDSRGNRLDGERVCGEPVCARCDHMGDTHMPLPDSPDPADQARDLARLYGMQVADPAPRATLNGRTVVDDLRVLLDELEEGRQR